MENKDMIDEIITMLDDSVAKGVGHLNITVESQEIDKVVEQLGCLDCEKGNSACSISTLHEGIDDKEETE